MATANPDLGKLGDELYSHWERAMGGWWDQVLENPSVLDAMGKSLGGAAQARGKYEKGVDDTMAQMHLPTRGDVIRVAKIAAMLEERVLQQEDLVLGLKDQMGRLEKEAVHARIEAAEARLELRETVAALRAELARGSSTTASNKSPSPPAARRKANS